MASLSDLIGCSGTDGIGTISATHSEAFRLRLGFLSPLAGGLLVPLGTGKILGTVQNSAGTEMQLHEPRMSVLRNLRNPSILAALDRLTAASAPLGPAQTGTALFVLRHFWAGLTNSADESDQRERWTDTKLDGMQQNKNGSVLNAFGLPIRTQEKTPNVNWVNLSARPQRLGIHN